MTTRTAETEKSHRRGPGWREAWARDHAMPCSDPRHCIEQSLKARGRLETCPTCGQPVDTILDHCGDASCIPPLTSQGQL